MSTHEMVTAELENLYALERLFQEHDAERALYEYLKNTLFSKNQELLNDFNRFLITEMSSTEKSPSVYLGGNGDGRTLERDIEHYLRKVFEKEYTIPSNFAQTLLIAEDRGYNRLLNAFAERKLAYTDIEGGLHNGWNILNELSAINNEYPDIEHLEDAVLALTTVTGTIDYGEYEKFRDIITNKYITKDEIQALTDALASGNPDYPKMFSEQYKKNAVLEHEAIIAKYDKAIAKMDELRMLQERDNFAYNKDFVPKYDLSLFTPEEEKEFNSYFDEIRKRIPDTVEDKEAAVLSLISEEQDKRLSNELANLKTEIEVSVPYSQAVQNIDIRQKAVESMMKNDSFSAFEDRSKLVKLIAKARWGAVNLAGKVAQIGVSEGMLETHTELLNNRLNFIDNTIISTLAQRCEDLQSQKTMLQLEIASNIGAQNRMKSFLNNLKLKVLDKQLSNVTKLYDMQMKHRTKIERKLTYVNEEKQRLTSRVNSTKYLKGEEFKDFSKNEKRLLYDFSMSAKKSFTPEEANVLLSTFVASRGMFNPKTILQTDLSQENLTSFAIDVAKNGLHLNLEKPTFLQLITKHKIATKKQQEMDAVFGASSFVYALPSDKQNFLIDSYKEGKDVEMLLGEARNFYNYKDYSIMDAQKSIKDKESAKYSPDRIQDLEHEIVCEHGEISDALKLACSAAATANKTIRTSFTEKEHLYELTVAKSGKQYVLKDTDLTTGNTSIIKSHNAINEKLLLSQEAQQTIRLSVDSFAQSIYEDAQEQKNTQKEKQKEERKARSKSKENFYEI